MITRLVKMTFVPEKREDFLALFNANKERIAGFDGCLQLELGNDIAQANIFFTISRWRSEEDLENYRRSELFASVWSKTKLLFAEKPEAWSLNIEHDSSVSSRTVS